jgi:tubulin-folding cofactor B
VEQRIDTSLHVDQLKDRLHLVTGSSPLHMRVFINGIQVTDSSRPLYELFPALPAHGTLIHVEDTDPHSALRALSEDDALSRQEKFTISEEDYAKRTDNARAWKERMLAEKRRKEEEKKAEEAAASAASASAAAAAASPEPEESESKESIMARIHVNDRCEIMPGARRGVVKFLGVVPELGPSGALWAGVQLDEPHGKHDGAVKGKRYFTAPANHGTFVKASMIRCGDFPERDPFADDADADELAKEL